MPAMSGNAYKLLGYAVWRAGKWYLRRRLPSARALAFSAVAAGAGLTATVVIAKRVLG
jgi:hypothetical protein